MKEITDILKAGDVAVAQGKQMALATVVHVEGSSYRRPGARMLVTEDGELTGAISGGCLEGDALRKAMLAMHEKQNKLVTYDTSDEDDAKFGVQLGCNGIVHILFEPILLETTNNPISILKAVASERADAVVVTFFSLTDRIQTGTVLMFKKHQQLNSLPDAWFNVICQDVEQAYVDRLSIFKEYNIEEKQVNAFIEFIAPPLAVIIAGAGNDAMPLVAICSILGWESTIVDGRASQVNVTRFPKATKLVVAKPAQVLARVVIDAQTAFVLMTHNYNYDVQLLKELLQHCCNYIGILGPKKKLQRMFDELEKNGFVVTDEMKERIYGPVGFDIGAETPEEIALSMAAEIKAVFNQRLGGSLRQSAAPIHQRNKLPHA